VTEEPREDISIHFMVEQLACEAFEVICRVADYLSTMGYCVPNHITIDVEGLPELFL
jgi:hypothetical protein